jgi:hypothetical protein
MHRFLQNRMRAIFEGSLVYAHIASTPEFVEHDYPASLDRLTEAHILRVKALLRMIDNEGQKFLMNAGLTNSVQIRDMLAEGRQCTKDLRNYLKFLENKQPVEIINPLEVLKESLKAYDQLLTTHSALQTSDREPMSLFSSAVDIADIDASGLIHDLGSLRLKAGHSIAHELSHWRSMALQNAVLNPSAEPLRVLIPLYQRYPGLLKNAVDDLDGMAIETAILEHSDEKVAMMLSCFSNDTLSYHAHNMTPLLLSDNKIDRLKLLYQAFAQQDRAVLSQTYMNNGVTRAIWNEAQPQGRAASRVKLV